MHRCTGSPGALVHLVYRFTGSPGAPVHWFTWCTSSLVHLVHQFTGSPGAPVHWSTWCTGSLVHLVHWCTGSTGMCNHYHKIYMQVKGQSTRTVIYIFYPTPCRSNPSPSKKLNTGEGHQSADYRGEHAQHYNDSLCLLVGSVIKWF